MIRYWFFSERKNLFWMQEIHGSQIKETARKVKGFCIFCDFCQIYCGITIKKNNIWQSVSLLQKKKKKKWKSQRQKFYMHLKINKISRGCFSKEPFNWVSLDLLNGGYRYLIFSNSMTAVILNNVGLCSSRAWWPLAPNFCSWAIRKSYFLHTNRICWAP